MKMSRAIINPFTPQFGSYSEDDRKDVLLDNSELIKATKVDRQVY